MIARLPNVPAVHRFAAALGLAGIGLLILAGGPLSRQTLSFGAAAGLAYGILLWLLLGYFADAAERLPPVDPVSSWRPRLVALALAVPFAVLAWQLSAGNQFRTVGVLAWIGAVAAWIAAWANRRPSAIPTPRPDGDPGRDEALSSRTVALLAVVMALAAFLYFHRLAETPGEPTSDHAETLLDLSDVLRGERPIFFIRNTGREPWKIYWLAVLVKGFGLPADFLTTKVGTVTTALFAIPAIFLLGRELGGDRLGLFAALLVAWSKWPLAMARLGIRVSYAVLPTAMVLWALLRWLRRGDRASVLWAGAWIGIGLYGYIPFRIVPLLVPLVAVLALVDPRWRGRRRQLLGDVALIAVTAAVVFLPLFHYMLEFPQFFWERMGERSTAHMLSRESLVTVAHNLWNMALAFHVRGDGGWVNFVTRDPFLDIVTGSLFLAGLALAFCRTFRSSTRWVVPIAGVFVLTLPSVLILTFAHENPSVNRSVAAIPVVFLLAAAPLDAIVGWLRPLKLGARIAGYAAMALLLAASLRASYRRYFVDYDRQYTSRVEHTLEMAREIRTWAARGIPTANAYVANRAYWLDPRNIAFELGDPTWSGNEIRPGEPMPALTRRPLLFLFHPLDEQRRLQLRSTYPGGDERRIAQRFPDRDFSIYVVR